MVTNYTIDGIRLDSAQQVDSAFLTSFQNAGASITTLSLALWLMLIYFQLASMLSEKSTMATQLTHALTRTTWTVSWITPRKPKKISLRYHELILRSYFWVLQAFESTSGSISNLVTGINTLKTSCADTTLLGNFLENHDIVRFASITSDISLAKNAIAFTMLQDGVSISKSLQYSPTHLCPSRNF